MIQTMIIKEKINLKEPIIPSSMLSEEEISNTLNNWIKLLDQHQIHIVFNQTPANLREQYDYIANEFLHKELPPHPKGLHFCFMYDRVTSDSTWSELDKMVHQMLEDVFRNKQSSVLPYSKKHLHFNEFENLSEPEFNYLMVNHNSNRSSISHCKIEFKGREIFHDKMDINGEYRLGYTHSCHCELQQGSWKVSLNNQEGNWAVNALYIDGC
ncbi:MAG: hypothetical protein RI965_74 [Bacteroidota bacterium]|jgi:hypothetical protein